MANIPDKKWAYMSPWRWFEKMFVSFTINMTNPLVLFLENLIILFVRCTIFINLKLWSESNER